MLYADEIDDGKECKICGKLKPIEEFYRNGVNKNGTIRRRAACKECFKSDEMPKYNSHKIYKQILTQDYLLDAYVVRGLDLEDIAAEIRTKYPKKYNCTATTISTYMRRHKISTRSVRSMVTDLDVDSIVRVIPKIEIQDQHVTTLYSDPDKEAINICISDTHVGQKFYNETEEEAVAYFNNAFEILETNIDKIIAHLKYDWQEINIFLMGDLLEGEGIYPNQAYESFQLMRQLDIAKIGFRNLILGLYDRYEIPINVICVRGNHGRTRFFSSEEANWDTVLYLLLEEGLAYNDDITFHRTDFWAIDYADTFNNKFLVTHGDALKGGNPSTGIKEALQGWTLTFGKFDVLLMGHFHSCTTTHISGVEAFTNGCFRYNDFATFKLKVDPDRHFWLFGSGEGRPVTWRYKVELEPKNMKDQIRQNIDTRSYGK